MATLPDGSYYKVSFLVNGCVEEYSNYEGKSLKEAQRRFLRSISLGEEQPTSLYARLAHVEVRRYQADGSYEVVQQHSVTPIKIHPDFQARMDSLLPLS